VLREVAGRCVAMYVGEGCINRSLLLPSYSILIYDF
jgi:hypothetical protein